MEKINPESALEIFNEIDVSKNGVLDQAEFLLALKKTGLGGDSSKERVAELFTQIGVENSNGDRVITFPIFLNFVCLRDADLRRMFDKVDVNKNGYLEIDEVIDALESSGLSASRSQVKKMLTLFDQDHDTKISFEEFRRMALLCPSIKIDQVFESFARGQTIGYYQIPMHTKKTKKKDFRVIICAGGLAGLVSRTLTAPADRIKVLAQASSEGSMASLIRNVWNSEGLLAFWRGNGVNVAKIIPESSIKFLAYEYLQEVVPQDSRDIKVHERFTCGALAGLIAQTVIYPMEVVKTRLAVSPPGTYSGVAACMRSTVKAEGVAGLYRGLMASNLGIVPYAGVDLGVYGTLKGMYEKRRPGQTPSSLEIICMGAFSSFCGQTVAYPLALVRTRLQSSGTRGMPVYNGFMDCIQQTAKQGGLRSFYRGIGANFAKGIPAMAISYAIYEKAKTIFS